MKLLSQFYVAYLSVTAILKVLVEKFVLFAVKHQFNETRVFLIENRKIENIKNNFIAKHCKKNSKN